METILVEGGNMKLSIYNKNHEIAQEQMSADSGDGVRFLSGEHESEIYVGSRKYTYQEGDYIRLEVDQPNTHVYVRFDDTFEESCVYFKDTLVWDYLIPMTADRKTAMKDTAFSGSGRYISARLASKEEIGAYQNLARNRHANYEDLGVYPYAHANVETRNDPTFFARNAIDGIFSNDDHGSYPYQSWGINQKDDAALTIDFGREVNIDKIGLTLRCDFPHDTWWNQVTLEFSDGSKETVSLEKINTRQMTTITPRVITWVRMCEMQKGEPGPFPALSQIEVFGHNV